MLTTLCPHYLPRCTRTLQQWYYHNLTFTDKHILHKWFQDDANIRNCYKDEEIRFLSHSNIDRKKIDWLIGSTQAFAYAYQWFYFHKMIFLLTVLVHQISDHHTVCQANCNPIIYKQHMSPSLDTPSHQTSH